MFLRVQGGDYIINVSQITHVEVSDDEWTVYLVGGEDITVDDPDEIAKLTQAMGL